MLPSSSTDNKPHEALLVRERANTLLVQFTISSNIDNIVEAIQLYRDAASVCNTDDDEHAMCLDGMGRSFSPRYTHLGKITDIHEAIYAHRRAVSLTAEGHTERPARLTHLGNACLRRFERLEELPDIDKAISAQQEAASLSLTPERYEERPSLLNNLRGLLLRRFERLHNMPDIEESIRIRTQTVELTPATHANLPSTGSLAFLPIHAAGLYTKRDQPKIFQYAVSSYTTTLTALVESSKKPRQASPQILAVSQPDTPGYIGLRGTVTKVEAIKTCIADKL